MAAVNQDPAGHRFFEFWLVDVAQVAVWAPLLLTIHSISRRQPAAPDAFRTYWRAIKTLLVVAWKGRYPGEDVETDGHEGLADDPMMALLKALIPAVTLPTFFWFAPFRLFPHSTATAVWLAATGVWTGASVYCVERARPYLKKEWLAAQQGRFFRRWWSNNPADYERPGRKWIVASWIFGVLVVATWVGVGSRFLVPPSGSAP